jgi:hypothetical protein
LTGGIVAQADVCAYNQLGRSLLAQAIGELHQEKKKKTKQKETRRDETRGGLFLLGCLYGPMIWGPIGESETTAGRLCVGRRDEHLKLPSICFPFFVCVLFLLEKNRNKYALSFVEDLAQV